MDVTFTCSGPDRSNDLRSLREWLPKADPGLQLRFLGSDQQNDRHLGLSVDELCAVISATADLLALATAVRGWVRNRFGRNVATEEPVVVRREGVVRIEVGPVTVTVTGAPDETAPAIEPDAG